MLNTRFRYSLPVLGLALAFAARSANGADIQYTDATSWTAAVTGVTAIPFSGIAPAGGSVTYNTSSGLVVNGVTFLGYFSPTAFQLSVVDSQFSTPYWNFGSPNVQSPGYDRAQTATFLPYIHVVLPAATTAFSTTLSTVSPNALVYQVTLSDGSQFFVQTGNRPTPTFIGITSSSAITYADFMVMGTAYNGGTYGLMQNFQTATTANNTPEAATMLLIGAGLLFVRSLRKNPKLFKLVHA